MDLRQPVEKLNQSLSDDSQIQEMAADCNALIDRYNSMLPSGNPASPAAVDSENLQSLYIQIVNYKKKIEKIRMGY